jgi:hypothetical protein
MKVINVTVKKLKAVLEDLPEDLNVVVDASDFGQDIIKSAKVMELYKGRTAHGEVFFEKNDFFMCENTTKEKVVCLSCYEDIALYDGVKEDDNGCRISSQDLRAKYDI